MADISNINLNGTSYTIKDSTARSTASAAQSTATKAQSTATQAQSTATQAQSTATQALEGAWNISVSQETLTIQKVGEA